jgi:hypothetical protein
VDRWIGQFGAAWGALGVIGLLLFAVYRLTPLAVEAFETGLTPSQWLITVVVCVGMAYSEGYRGFQLRFSPRTAARIRYLRDRPNPIRSLLAPFFAMGWFHATRRTKIVSYGFTIGIIVLVVLVQRLDQPWRGIVDAGVIVGLTWGTISFAASLVRALTRSSYPVSPETGSQV